MKKAEIVERINSIDLEMLNIAVHAICASNPINPISANHGVITSRCGSVTRLGFTTRATKANMEAVYYSILDRIVCCWDLETAHEIDPDYTPTWAIQIDPEDATPTREEVEAVLQESEEAETRAQALITELRGTTEAAKALIEDAASITGKSAADFAGALSEYAAIVRGVAEEYQGKATVAMIRADHPELDFFDDEDIETRCPQRRLGQVHRTVDEIAKFGI